MLAPTRRFSKACWIGTRSYESVVYEVSQISGSEPWQREEIQWSCQYNSEESFLQSILRLQKRPLESDTIFAGILKEKKKGNIFQKQQA